MLLQVFYHLGELDDALTYALGAGKLFNIEEQSEYVQTIVGGFVTLACSALRLLPGLIALLRSCPHLVPPLDGAGSTDSHALRAVSWLVALSLPSLEALFLCCSKMHRPVH